jgi:hypothetical protein
MIFAALAMVTACAAPMDTETRAVSPQYISPVLAPEVVRAAPGTSESSAVTCDIRETKTKRGLRLEAIVQADRSVHGTYDFVVTAQSSGGSSDVTQGGPLQLAAGQNATVGAAEIPSGRYRAVLLLGNAGGDLCNLERRS